MCFKLGKIYEHAKPFYVVLFFLQFIVLIVFLGYRYYMDSSESCIYCHASKEKMTEFGYPQFYVTVENVKKQTGHKNISCRDCHLGNGRAYETQKAHEGMLKAIFVNDSAEVVERKKVFSKEDTYVNKIVPKGENELFELLPQKGDIRNILWHDRNLNSFNFDPEIAKKTCGKRGCHSDELKQFQTTIMARNYRQRTMKTWLEPYGPHNCGPSFADIPPEEILTRAGFDFTNTEKIRNEINITFTDKQAITKQRLCNVCHAGCLDCHYAPSKEKGSHGFIKIPDSYSCMGRGRGNSVCHTGSGHSRRGESYIGKFYSIPQGRQSDVHFKKGIHCRECHPTGSKGMGDMQRKATCQDCHLEIEKAHSKSIHKNLTCTACHISEAGGYQITIWGNGFIGKKTNPFKKYSLYYGIQKPLILMKDQKGIWFPVKIFPHSVGNIKIDVSSSGLKFRWMDGQTRDMYYIVGTVDNLPSGNKHLLWFQIEEVSHPFGKARECSSCHKKQQISVSNWQYEDTQGAEPFKGGYRIIADKKGLRITDFWHTRIKLLPGYELTDFASWIYTTDKWFIPGDFTIKADEKKYQKYEALYKKKIKEIQRLQKLTKDENRKKQLKQLRAIFIHNPDSSDIINHDLP